VYESSDFLVASLLFLGAILYTSVGHAGASAYIAIMSLSGLPQIIVKPTALVLNILVASYSGRRYFQSGLFDEKVFYPLVAGAVPAAFIGGYLTLSETLYKTVVGIVLIASGIRFLLVSKSQQEHSVRRPSFAVGMIIGAVIGLLAGLTGTGGGIFLSPILIFLSWTSTKAASGTASLFILVNSLSGLLGNVTSVAALPSAIPLYGLAVLLGAFIGTSFGIRYFSHIGVKRALGMVLLIAGGKLALDL